MASDTDDIDLVGAASRGDDYGMQIAMRQIVAAKIADPNCPARELASLTKRLHEINREIKELEAAKAELDDDADPPDEDFNPDTL